MERRQKIKRQSPQDKGDFEYVVEVEGMEGESNPDNNQHSPNENLRLGQIDYGIRALFALLTTPREN